MTTPREDRIIIGATPTPGPTPTPTPTATPPAQGEVARKIQEPEKKTAGPDKGQITEAIREGFARALMEAGVPPAIRDLLMSQAGNLDDKLLNLAGKPFPDTATARQGAYYFMNSYVLPAAQNLGYDVLLGPEPDQWAYITKLVSDPKLWYKNLEMALYQTKQEMAAIESLPDPEAESAIQRPEDIAARAAQAIRATIPQVWKAAPPPGLKAPDLVAESYEHPARRTTPKPPPESPFTPGWMPFENRWEDEEGLLPPGYVVPGGPQTVSERIAEERQQRERQAIAMKAAGYVPSVRGGWVRPGEQGSAEAEEAARQGREATFRAVAPMVQAGETAVDERQAQRAQEERIAAQVAPYTGTVPKSYTAREAFEVGRGNLGALEALASGGRAAYESAKLGTNIEQKFGQSRLRSEFPTPSAGYETSIAGQWGGGNPVEVSQKMQAAREPWTARRMAEPLAAKFPKEWEQYAAPRTYGWEKGPAHVSASQFTPEEPFDMPFEGFLKKRLAPKEARPAPRGRSIFRFGGR